MQWLWTERLKLRFGYITSLLTQRGITNAWVIIQGTRNKSLVRIVTVIVDMRYEDMKNPNPSCVDATLDEMRNVKQVKRNNNNNEWFALLKSMSLYDIKNVLACKHLPLPDHQCNLYGMTPPETFHASVQGLINYMFES